MKIEQVMTSPVQTIRRRESLAKGARLLYEQGGGCLAVVDGEGRVLGVVTEASVCRATGFIESPPMETPVSVALSATVPSLEVGTSLEQAHDHLRRSRTRCALVVGSDGRPKGLVTLDDLSRHAVQDLLSQCSSYRAEQVVRTLAETRPPFRLRHAMA
ncbi:MAG: CBS domain-containing protein [Myxococcota bacterium]